MTFASLQLFTAAVHSMTAFNVGKASFWAGSSPTYRCVASVFVVNLSSPNDAATTDLPSSRKAVSGVLTRSALSPLSLAACTRDCGTSRASAGVTADHESAQFQESKLLPDHRWRSRMASLPSTKPRPAGDHLMAYRLPATPLSVACAAEDLESSNRQIGLEGQVHPRSLQDVVKSASAGRACVPTSTLAHETCNSTGAVASLRV